MTRQSATTVTAASRLATTPPLSFDRYIRPRLSPSTSARRSVSTSARRSVARAVSIFRGGVTNSLEMRRAEFHYSVIGRYVPDFLAFRYAGSHCLNDEVSALNFEFAAAAADAGFSPNAGASEGESMLYPNSKRSRLRTSGRKTYAKSFGFSQKIQNVISAVNIRMIRIDENIHATYPLCATVAPILHTQARDNVANRSLTFNNGATDADGR
jgi:hypothetical protein